MVFAVAETLVCPFEPVIEAVPRVADATPAPGGVKVTATPGTGLP
jgi:hypothetical protein